MRSRKALIDYKLYVWLCLRPLSLIFSYAKLSDELIRISIVRKHQNFNFEIFGEKNFDRLLCRLHTRAVAIIVDYNFARKPT